MAKRKGGKTVIGTGRGKAVSKLEPSMASQASKAGIAVPGFTSGSVSKKIRGGTSKSSRANKPELSAAELNKKLKARLKKGSSKGARSLKSQARAARSGGKSG